MIYFALVHPEEPYKYDAGAAGVIFYHNYVPRHSYS